jgi:flagellar basal-body rod protein FlgB
MPDPVMDTLQQAMSGLALRQRVIAANVANVQTPGYQASKVDFETSLRQAIASGTPAAATPSVTQSTDPAIENGNNVSLDDETLNMIQTNLRYHTVVEGMNAKFRLLRSAIGNV